jgi:hypothetical protein
LSGAGLKRSVHPPEAIWRDRVLDVEPIDLRHLRSNPSTLRLKRFKQSGLLDHRAVGRDKMRRELFL